jgi:hypothetical protein
MAATRKPQRAVVLDAQEPHEPADATYPDDLAAATDEAGDASLCPTCGEPLTWHEEACYLPGYPAPAELLVVAEPTLPLAATTYAYDLGRLVQPTTQQQAHPVVWRGQLKERHPATGLVHRVNVYRLGDGYWDCYREEELLAA